MIHQRMCNGFVGALAALLLSSAVTTTGAFTTPTSPRVSISSPRLAASTTALAAASSPDLVVISPPGGIGEITSIEAARLGGSVKWFVVSAPEGSSSVPGTKLALTAETLAAIEKSGGALDLAGATADSLLAQPDEGSGSNTNGALNAMASWCGSGSASGNSGKTIICTYDGADEEKLRLDRTKSAEERDASANDEVELIRSGVRVAAREAVRGGSGKTIALLAAGEELSDGDDEEEKGPGFLAGLFGGNVLEVPETLGEAMKGTSAVMRYGELFGAPESSPESSPFMGGPRRDPTVREMYTLRSVRIDPTVSGGDTGSKTNRLSMGEAASRLGLGKVASSPKMDVSLSSFAGTDSPDEEEWTAEFARAAEMTSSSASSGGARLFAAEFSSVPSTKRLAEWLATKWAPAILRGYDIAGTRVGARPVYALQTGDDTVEIVWQQLVDFSSVTSGKMIIQVDERGMTAVRGGGDAKGGFGGISSKPLPGEDILVRRLGDAASQAVEKGLAVKPQVAKKVVPVAKPVTTVAAVTAAAAEPAAPDAGPGPRGAGARRSAERTRGSGKRRKATPKPSSDGD